MATNVDQNPAYGIIEGRNNLITTGRYDSALMKNLRNPSPIKQALNRDNAGQWVTSNAAFYGAPKKADAVASKPQHREFTPAGYDSADPRAMPTKAPSERRFQDVRRKAEAPRVDEDARSNAPERHYQKSQRSSSVNAKPAAAYDSAPVERSEHAANYVGMDHGRAQNAPSGLAPLRPARAETAKEQSVRSGRNRTAESRREPEAQSNNAAGEAVYDLRHNKIGIVSKGQAPYVVIDKDGVSRCGTIYEKVSGSQVSSPEDMVCDNCANKNIAENKAREREEQRERDAEFARKVGDNLRNQLEEERRRQLDKLKTYQDAIENQRRDQRDRKDAEKVAKEVEDEKIRKMLENRDDEIARMEKDRLKRLNFIGDLRDQMDQKKDLERAKKDLEADEDRRNPNLLIDDAWRGPHRDAMKDYYRNFLNNQLDEKDHNKNLAKEKAKAEDEDYKRRLAQMNAEELAKHRDLEDAKRRVFMDEIQRQLADKDRSKEFEKDLKNLEDDNYRKKLAHDRQVDLDNLFKKKQQVDDYLNTLGKQIVDKDMEKRIAELEAKKRYNTTLCLGKKPVKCYNCAVCRSLYPLKMLNKKHHKA